MRVTMWPARTVRCTLVPLLVSAVLVGPAAMRAGGSPTRNTTILHVALDAAPLAHRVRLAGADELAPGDTMARALDLRGAATKGTVTMQVVPTNGVSSRLDTDRRSGLQLSVVQCVGANARFTRTATTLKCVHGHVRSLARVPVADAERRPIALPKAVLARSMHMRLQLTFPRSADNRFQDLSSSLDFRFTVHVRK